MEMAAAGKNIVVFGASGNVGQYLVQYALEQGFDVTAVVRKPNTFLEALKDPKLTILEGDISNDQAFVEKCIEGKDIVLSSLGNRLPGFAYWNQIENPESLPNAFRKIVLAMEKHNVSKILAVSSAGVNESWYELPLPVRAFYSMTAMTKILAILATMENILLDAKSKGKLDVCIVRPTRLVTKPLSKSLTVANSVAERTPKTPRSDVAYWMIEEALKPGPFAHSKVQFSVKQ